MPNRRYSDNLCLARIAGTDQLPTKDATVDEESNEPNEYDDLSKDGR